MTHELTRRMWTAVMPGDIVRDGRGRSWSVARIVHEPGTRPGDGSVMCWVELAGGPRQGDVTMRIPDASTCVEMSQGPGWGVAGETEQAMSWVVGLLAQTCGGTLLDA